MPKELGTDAIEDSIGNLKALHISSIENEEEEEHYVDDVNMNGGGGGGDNDDEEEEEEHEPMTLGFIENPRSNWSLLHHLFPSKAGGIPAWLDPVNLPSGRSYICDLCGEPLQFMLQVYAPISENELAFHQTLFVFMCPSMSCLVKDQHEQLKCQERHLGGIAWESIVYLNYFPFLPDNKQLSITCIFLLD